MPRGVGSLLAFLVGALPDPAHRARGGCWSIGLVLAVVALWQMAHFDLSMTAEADHDLRPGPGLRRRPAVRAAEHPGLRHARPVHRTEGTIVNTMARSLGSSLGISMISGHADQQLGARPRGAGRQHHGGNPVLSRAALPARSEPRRPAAAWGARTARSRARRR